jgi:outer membrane protein assembly factor BamB
MFNLLYDYWNIHKCKEKHTHTLYNTHYTLFQNTLIFKYKTTLNGQGIDATTVIIRETIEALTETIVMVANTTTSTWRSITISTISIVGWRIELANISRGRVRTSSIGDETSIQSAIQDNLLTS